MAHELIRLEKRPNKDGDEEIFVELVINDELGIYHYAKWLTPGEYTAFQEDYDEVDFKKITHIKHLKTVKSKKEKAGEKGALDLLLEKHVPTAKKLRQDSQEEEAISRAERRKAAGLN